MKVRKLHAAAVAAAAMLAGSSAIARDEYVYGPPPDWTHYKQLGEAAVRAALPDQASWQVEWPNAYVKRGWNHKGQWFGYATCGVLRPTGSGGSSDAITAPVRDFVIVIDHDMVKTFDISPRNTSTVAIVCHSLVQQGQIPLASTMISAPSAPSELAVTSLGMTIRPMPDGAYLVAVTAGSPAARAGLVPGAVITRVNGIALAGMGTAMATLLGADAPSLAVDTAAGSHVEVSRGR